MYSWLSEKRKDGKQHIKVHVWCKQQEVKKKKKTLKKTSEGNFNLWGGKATIIWGWESPRQRKWFNPCGVKQFLLLSYETCYIYHETKMEKENILLF